MSSSSAPIFKEGEEFELLKDILDSIEKGSSSSSGEGGLLLGSTSSSSSTIGQTKQQQSSATAAAIVPEFDLEQFDLLTLHHQGSSSHNSQPQQQENGQQPLQWGSVTDPRILPHPQPTSLSMSPSFSSQGLSPPIPFSASPPSTSTSSSATAARLCQVCHSLAGKHNYYGGQVCESCRAFFRRTVQSENYQQGAVVCKLSGECDIDSKSRKSCGSCRYKKCLRAGMNPNWLMTDKERKMKRGGCAGAGRIKLSLVPSKEVLETPLKMPFSMEEVLKMKEMFDDLKVVGYDSLCDIFSRDLRTPNRFFEMMHSGATSRDPLLLKEIEAHERERFIGIAFRVEEIDDVPRQDRHKLVRHNFPIYFAILISLYFGEHDFDSLYGEYREYIRNFKQDCPGMAHVLGLFDTLSRDGKRLQIRYEQLYTSPWAPNNEIEARHRKLCADIQRWPRHKDNDPYDDILILFTLLNTIFSTNGLDLPSGKKIESIQNYYAMMVYRYLKTYSPEQSRAKFAQGLMIPAMARECYDLHCQMLPI